MGRDFPPIRTGPWVHPASCTMGTGSFAGVMYSRGVLLTTHPILVPRLWKSRAIYLYTRSGPVTGTLYLTSSSLPSLAPSDFHPFSPQKVAKVENTVLITKETLWKTVLGFVKTVPMMYVNWIVICITFLRKIRGVTFVPTFVTASW